MFNASLANPSSGATSGDTRQVNYGKILRKTWVSRYKMTNAQTSPVEIWEYRCMARGDSTVPPDTILTKAWGATANEVKYNAVAALAIATPTNPLISTTLGATPFMCNPFCAQYKILKVKKRIIMPGKWWSVAYKSLKPRVYSAQRIMRGEITAVSNGPAPTFVMLKGQKFSLFVASGTAASNVGSAAGFEVGLSNVNLLVDHRVKVHYSIFPHQYSTGAAGVFQAGFSAADGPQIPLPQVQNQPLYAIGTVSTTNGTVQPMVNSAAGPLTVSGGVDSAACTTTTAGPIT